MAVLEQGRVEGKVGGAPVQPPAFLRPSKPRRLPRVPAASLGDLALHEPQQTGTNTPLALSSALTLPPRDTEANKKMVYILRFSVSSVPSSIFLLKGIP